MQLLLQVWLDQNHLMGNVACVRTNCGHLNRNGDLRSPEKSLKGTKVRVPPHHHHLSTTWETFVWATNVHSVLRGPKRHHELVSTPPGAHTSKGDSEEPFLRECRRHHQVHIILSKAMLSFSRLLAPGGGRCAVRA